VLLWFYHNVDLANLLLIVSVMLILSYALMQSLSYANYDPWMAGQWKTSGAKLNQFQPQSFNDGQLEILSIHNTWTGGCAFLDICRTQRLVQATAVRMRIQNHPGKNLKSQVDGEAFQLTDGYIHITPAPRVKILVNPHKDSSWVANNPHGQTVSWHPPYQHQPQSTYQPQQQYHQQQPPASELTFRLILHQTSELLVLCCMHVNSINFSFIRA
jgi:hypothetical protein